jgi:hypothetical protein
MTLSVYQIMERRMVEWLVNDELQRMWKEAIVTYLRYYSGMCLEVLREATKNSE